MVVDGHGAPAPRSARESLYDARGAQSLPLVRRRQTCYRPIRPTPALPRVTGGLTVLIVGATAFSAAASSSCWRTSRGSPWPSPPFAGAREAYCARRSGARARLVPTTFDREGDLAAQLAELDPAVLVDASGRSRAMAAIVSVIEACIAT
jgi:hypothetical protein